MVCSKHLTEQIQFAFLLAFFTMRDNMHSWDKQFSPRIVSRGIGRDSIGAVGMVEKKMA